MRYFPYKRKSQDSDERQAQSIPSQDGEINRAFGSSPDIVIIDSYSEERTAKRPGRPLFNEMLDRIERGEADGILAWHPDRLARNSVDAGRIIDMLDRGTLKDIKFCNYSFENNAQGKFMLNIAFSYSKYYVDTLSDNVKRGNRTKIASGGYPGKAAIGYLNDRNANTIVRDPVRFPIVRRIWDLMLTGVYSPHQIWEMTRFEWGLTTRPARKTGGKPLNPSYIYLLLKNPFYAGMMRWMGQVYPARHEAMVTADEFEQVQRMLAGKSRQRPKAKSFAYTGIIRCAECGCMVTAEVKRRPYGTYVYYHCSKRRRRDDGARCSQPCIRLEELESQIAAFVSGLAIPKAHLKWIEERAESEATQENQSIAEQRQGVETAIARVRQQLNNALDLRVRDMMSDEQYFVTRERLQLEEARLKEAMANLEKRDRWFEPTMHLMEFSAEAKILFESGDDNIRRQVLRIVGSNLTLKDKKLRIEATKPFVAVAAVRDFRIGSAVVEDVRTLNRVLEDLRNYSTTDETTREAVKRIQLLFSMTRRDLKKAA